MKLKSLELQGFKSFPDKTKLDFGEGITAVVGPNGSGKSNISDAVRWVLGEQSTKSLRGSKMEDVIFIGASGRRALGFAEVSLTLDNSDRSLNIDEDEVTVTRRYYRSGESDYMINRTGVRLRDIHELFMDTGLGRDGYSIISQGKIADIVASKSADRREIFEEASGISKYRYRKTDAEHKLKNAEENMLRLKDILSELEIQVGPLKAQSEKAHRFIGLTAEKRKLEIGLWLRTLENSNDTLREQEKRVMIVSEQHDQVSGELEEIERRMEQGRGSAQYLTAQIEKLRHDQSAFEEESVKIKGQADVLKNDTQHNSQSILRLDREIEEAKENGENTENAIKVRLSQITELQEVLGQKQTQLKRLEEGLAQIRKETDGQVDLKEDLENKILKLTGDISDIKLKQATISSSVDEITTQATALENSLREREKRITELTDEQKFMGEELEEGKKRITANNDWIDYYNELSAEQGSRLEKLVKRGDELKLDVNDKNRRIEMLKQLDKDLEGFTRSVKAVIKGSQNGSLKGIYGTVSMLMKTENKYAVAVETALGGAMQNVITANENNAKTAIQMLKDRDSGRATFLPLNVIKGNTLNLMGLQRNAGFIGIASNLISYDSQYDNVFKYLLGQTVIVDNLDNAISLARRYNYRFKIVTLDGQVINARGSMTGGSNSKNSGLISRGAQIEALTEQLKKLEIQIRENNDLKTKQSDEYNQTQLKLIEIRDKLAVETEDRIRIESELRNIGNQLEGVKLDAKNIGLQLSQTDARKKALEDESKEHLERVREMEASLSDMKNRLSGITDKQEKAAAQIYEINSRIAEIKLSELTVNKDIEAVNYSVEQLATQKKSFTERMDDLLLEKKKYISSNESLDKTIEELLEKAKKLHEDSVKCGEEIERSHIEREKTEKGYQELRAREREKTEEKEKVGRELARLDERRVSLQKDYDEIIKKLWDQYELTRNEALQEVEPAENPVASQRKLNSINSEIKSLGSVNLDAIDRYKEVSERYEFLGEQLSDVEKAAAGLNRLINELTVKMREIFNERFRQINENFGQIFAELFGGGKASLSLSDPTDILNSGIDINVQPPGKIINNLDSLSGGEKAFVAICLYFSILKVNPSPFCILDEIEAALDEVNVDRFAEYIHTLTGSTQFICITHRHGTMKQADMLYGVTMQQNGVSKLLSLNVNEVLGRMA